MSRISKESLTPQHIQSRGSVTSDSMKSSLRRFLVASLSVLLLFMMSGYLSFDPIIPTSPILVSLTTTIGRADYELGITLYSLLHQSLETKINVYVPQDEEILFLSFMSENPNSLLHNPRVTVIPTFDWGPSTKFIPVIESLIKAKAINTRAIVCDDDHYYSSSVIKTLVEHHASDPSKAYGFRGLISYF
jgi:hypothetical protein